MSETGDELQCLRRKLKESEEQVQQAAQAGLDLINHQMDLQTRLEEQRVEMTNSIEALEQDKYSLQREVELKTRMLESLQSDYNGLKSQQMKQFKQHEENLLRNYRMELSDLKNKVVRLQSDLEESQLNENQLKHKLKGQTEILNYKMEELQARIMLDNLSSETSETQTNQVELENAKVELQHSLQEARYREQQLELGNTNLQRQLQQVTEEKEEQEKEVVSLFNALQKNREANQDLQVQLEQLLQQAQDPNSKGNSLFAELEDKRAEMEKRVISMKVQYQSLQKDHVFSRQQLHRMKVQIATLMQLQGSRVDPAQLERLQSVLTERNGEIQNLMSKLRRLEKVEMMVWSQPSSTPTDSGDRRDETYYTDLLKMKLSNSVKDAERLGDELSFQRIKSLTESQRALELERKLFSSEQLLKQAQSDKIKLQLKVEALQHKYEPNEVNKNQIQKRKREKLPVDVISCSEASSATIEFETVAQPIAENQPKAISPHSYKPKKGTSFVEVPKPCLQPTKCVRYSEVSPLKHAATPPRSSMTDSGEMVTNTGGEEADSLCTTRTKQRNMAWQEEQSKREVIHVTSKTSMESQCAQQ